MDVANGLSAIPAHLESLEKSAWVSTQMLVLSLNTHSLNIITAVSKMCSLGVESTL